MFEKLNRKIKKTILILTTTFTLLISIISVISLSSYLVKDFKKSSQDMINLAITNFNFDISLIKSSSDIISQSSDIKTYLTSTTSAQNALNKISSISSYFESVLGVTLYGSDQTKSLSTTTISGYPSLNELKSLDDISSFINSDEDSYMNIRTSHIANFYNSTVYNESYGMISYMIKIYDNEQTIGYLVVDIDPEYMYLKHFDFSEYDNYKGIISMITTIDNSYLKYSQNLKMNDYLSVDAKDNIYMKSYSKYIYRTSIINNYDLICVIPSSNVFNQIYLLIGLFILINVVTFFINYFIANKLAKYVTVPLTKLLNRMRNDEITKSNI